MKRLTVSLEQEQIDRLDDLQDEHDIDSRSAALRQLFHEYEDIQKKYEELNNKYEHLDEELQRQKRERRQILDERDEKRELARYVEDERTTQQRWREASLATRLKWKITGMPSEDSE